MKVIYSEKYNSEHSRKLKERGGKRMRIEGKKKVHESYAQCGCAARLGEFVTASGGYLRRGGGCIPGLTHFFVEYYLCTPSGCKYSCGMRARCASSRGESK